MAAGEVEITTEGKSVETGGVWLEQNIWGDEQTVTIAPSLSFPHS